MSKLGNRERSIIKAALLKRFTEKTSLAYEKAIFDASKLSDLPYRDVAYDVLGKLIVSDKETRVTIYKDLKRYRTVWDSVIFEPQKLSYEKSIDRTIQKPVAIKGLYKCKNKKCGSDEFYTWSLQTRSGDEGMTHFRECAKCGARNKEGG